MEFRKVLAEEIISLMEEDEKVILLDADLASPNGTSPVYKAFPNRCFDVGIQEANMASVAAGLSAYGYKPIIVSFAPFVTRRIYDQIAVSISYAKQNVKIIGTDPGLSAELNGGTHMTFADMALIRCLPDFVIYDAVDDIQYRSALKTLLRHNGNVYIRAPRKSRPTVFKEDYEFHLGKIDVVSEGKDISIIASGTMVYEALAAKEILKNKNIDVEIISINTLNPLDKEGLLNSIKKTNKVLTVENHNMHGGVYSNICELTAEYYPIKVNGIGITDKFGQVGKYDELLKEYHLTANDIVIKVEEILQK